ncbi:scavenger receptor cysteine-rich type 1 protein M130-like [Saccostrea echinata]|uniref:scavenger receptor cysteine-rich type 1 protein M130-like n=1 Tax=Saccostrea echinata TaxID=191078 RepID=UPI002A7FFFEF|nr:scavenger receptor cysteine-rich type 1 protein M130-like [Saccostrea echinata]
MELTVLLLLGYIFYECRGLQVSLSNQYYGNLKIDGSFVCGGENVFSYKEATMLCRHLGFSGGVPLPPGKMEVSFPIGIRCSGNESSVSQCNTSNLLCPSVSPWDDEKTGVARILCYQNGGKSEGRVNLKSGLGRVTVSQFGLSASVCADSWTDVEASVTCKMFGFNDGIAFDINKSARDEFVLFGKVTCFGNESSFFDCYSQGTECRESYAVNAGVLCYNKYAPYIQFNGEMGLYELVIDNYTVMYCSQTHFYPPSVHAPHTDNPANTIPCGNIVILDHKIRKTTDSNGVSFPLRKLCKAQAAPTYNCNGGWKYSSEWKKKHPESFMCGKPWVSSGTLFTC